MPAPLTLRRLFAPLILPFRTRIRSGPNEGCWWSLASGRYLKGDLEGPRMALLEEILSEGDVCWDVGAHHGYVSLHASRRVGPSGRVYAFEPSPYNLAYLRRHLEWNARDNIDLKAMAIGATAGTAHIAESGSSRAFALGSEGPSVRIESLPRLVDQHGLHPPDLLKVDVEGAEGDLVEAAAEDLLPDSWAIVAIHSLENYQRVTTALTDVGFTVLDSAGTRRLREIEPGDWSEDPDVLAYGPDVEVPGARIMELLGEI